MEWHYVYENETYAVDEAEIPELIKAGYITKGTQVYSEEIGDWTLCKDTGLVKYFPILSNKIIIKSLRTPSPDPARDDHANVVHEKEDSGKTADADEVRPSENIGAKAFDKYLKISAWVAGSGLLLLALSPFFKWVNFGSGGVTGISGDGKIVLGVTVLAIAAYVVAMVKGKWVTPIFLGIQTWGTLAVFWMGSLIWQFGSLFDSSDMSNNPFTALFATQISPGAGLYFGLIGGIAIAGALGFIVVQRLLAAGNLRHYYVTQGLSCILGVLLAFFVGSDRLGQRDRTTAKSASPVASTKTIIQAVELEPTLMGKRFIKEDFQEFIQLDVDWTAKKFKKSARAVKGSLHLTDLFGESKLIINMTINRAIDSGDRFTENAGFKYNQFMNSHVWVRSTSKENIRLIFVPKAIIYADGTEEDF